MRDESELKMLQRQIARAEALIRQTIMKVENLEASVDEFNRLKERVVIFPGRTDGKLPVRVDKSGNIGDFVLT